MSKLVNESNIPLPMAVFLAANSYDFKPNPLALSVTDFNKSIRQIILRNRAGSDNEMDKEVTDILTLVKSKMGTAIHDSIERVWLDPVLRSKGLRALGYPEKIIERIKVNPEPKDLTPDTIPVYMELRKSIKVDGYTISGKFDFVAEGMLTDFKSTGTWKWSKLETADEDYRRQGSLYKLIHEDIVTEEYLQIIFLFTDWSENRAKADPKKYPPSPSVPHKVKLWTKEETLKFIKQFIADIEKYKDVPESELPECTPEQLWQDKPTYKYFKNPEKMSRATKNFDSYYEAQTQFVKDGAVGVVVTVESEAKACKYCSSYNICTQKDKLIASGTFKP